VAWFLMQIRGRLDLSRRAVSYEAKLRSRRRMREQFNQEEHVDDHGEKDKKDAASSIRPRDINGAEKAL